MEFFDYILDCLNYIQSKWKIIVVYGIIIAIFLFIVFFIIWIIVSYYILKWFKKNIDDNFYFNNYTEHCEKQMKLYGDLPIKRIYLVRKPVFNIGIFLLNLFTLYKYDSLKNKFFNHTSIIVEVELSNKFRKNILIEKNNCINICSNFKYIDKQDLMKIPLKKKITINKLLEKTRKRISDEKFFNWHIYKNNCQNLTKEFLITLKANKKYNKFIDQSEIIKKLKLSDFKLHIMNCVVNLYNLIQSFTDLQLV